MLQSLSGNLTIGHLAQLPMPSQLSNQLVSQDLEYSDIDSGNITLLSERTVKIERFNFAGSRIPGRFFVIV